MRRASAHRPAARAEHDGAQSTRRGPAQKADRVQPSAELPPDLIASKRPPRQQVEIIVPLRTLVVLLAFGVLVVLAILSLGTLLSIFVAGVLALGLDPVVGALVARGWKRGRAALFVFAMLFVARPADRRHHGRAAVGPGLDFIREIPTYWDQVTNSAAFQKLVSQSDQAVGARRAQGPRQRPAGCREHAAGRGRRHLRPLLVAGDADLPGAVPAHGAPDPHRLAVRVHPGGGRGALAAGARGLDRRGVGLAHRQRRHLPASRRPSPACRRGRSACRSRSCWR